MDGQIGGGNNRVLQVTRTRKDGWTKAKRKTFLDALAATCNVKHAAREAGMSTTGLYMLRSRDPAFAELWREAMATGYERLEELLLTRALTGVNALVIGEDAEGGAEDGAAPVTLAGGEGLDGAEPAARAYPKASGFRPATGLSAARGLPVDLQLAMYLVNRHRAVVEGRTPHPRGRRPATQEETDAALATKLDTLERRLKAST